MNTNYFDYVDLGLPSGTLWAKCNLGATKPEEYGDYYMWGSVKPNTTDVCDWEHTPYQTQNTASYQLTKFTKYFDPTSPSRKDILVTDENILKTVLDNEDDAAYVATNGKAHIPTKEQCEELLVNTTNEWTTRNGVNGRVFTSKKNGNSIFIPASGLRNGGSFGNKGDYSYVWSSSLNLNNPNTAWLLFFHTSYCFMNYFSRNNGFAVRPVIG